MIILKNVVKPWDVWHQNQHASKETDITFHIGLNGQKVHAHSHLFARLSPFIRKNLQLVSCHCKQQPCPHEAPHLDFILDGFNIETVRAMLELVYNGALKADVIVLERVAMLLMHLKIELNTTWLAEEEINSSVCLKCNVCDTIEVLDKSSESEKIDQNDDEEEDSEPEEEQPNESEMEPTSTDKEDEPSSLQPESDAEDGFEPLDDSVADPDHIEDIDIEDDEEDDELDVEHHNKPQVPVMKTRSPRKVLGEIQKTAKDETSTILDRSSLPDSKNMSIKSCHCCTKKFRNTRDLKNHLCLHYKTELFRDYAINREECKLCGFKDKQVMRLAGHIGYKHDKLKEYVSEEDQPEVHMKARSLDKNIQTKLLIDDEYGRALLRKELADIDLLEKPCNLCGKLHPTKHRRMKHIANHFGSFLLKHFPRLKGNVCTICGKDLARGGSVYYHLGFVHKGLEQVAENSVQTTPKTARKSRRQMKL